jgi:glycosyltransferase involved in cell wall biosynthesis
LYATALITDSKRIGVQNSYFESDKVLEERIHMVLVTWRPRDSEDYNWHWGSLPTPLKRGKTDVVGFRTKKSWPLRLCDFPSIYHTAVQIREYDIIIFYGHSHMSLMINILRNLKIIRLPFVVIIEFHLKEKEKSLRSWIKYAVVRYAYSKVEKVFVFSQMEVDYFEKVLAWSKAKLRYMIQAVNYRRLEDYPEPSYSPGDYILSAGRTSRDYRTLRDALTGFGENVIIVTDSKNVRGLCFGPNVTVLDVVPSDTYLRLIARAKYLVLPLKESRHSAGGRSLFYALERGKAVIVSKTEFVEEYFTGSDAVLKVPIGDPEALRLAMLSLSNNPEATVSLGRKAREFVEHNYTSEAYITHFYEAIIRDFQRAKLKDQL